MKTASWTGTGAASPRGVGGGRTGGGGVRGRRGDGERFTGKRTLIEKKEVLRSPHPQSATCKNPSTGKRAMEVGGIVAQGLMSQGGGDTFSSETVRLCKSKWKTQLPKRPAWLAQTRGWLLRRGSTKEGSRHTVRGHGPEAGVQRFNLRDGEKDVAADKKIRIARSVFLIVCILKGSAFGIQKRYADLNPCKCKLGCVK